MATYTAILKGYRLYVTFSDGSTGFTDYPATPAGFEALGEAVNSHFENELSEVNSIVMKKNWSEKGETVPVPVQYQA